MDNALHLQLTDYQDDARWRWVLNDANGVYLADHDVDLADGGRYLRGFRDLTAYLDYYSMAFGAPAGQLAELGAWIGENVFGDLRPTLAQRLQPPATVVHVRVPAEAQDLLFRPLELARFPDGRSFVEAGLRFVYQLHDPAARRPDKETGDVVRLLAVFSLPSGENPLNLRRQRYQLERLVRDLQRTKSAAVELRVLQYGATRETLKNAMEQAPGWDVIHLSGHGIRGKLLLEDDAGGLDEIEAEDLADLLRVGSRRLKLLILDACYSGAASHTAARAQVGLDREPVRHEDGNQEVAHEDGNQLVAHKDGGDQEVAHEEAARPTELPSLAQDLAAALDCAALAMRYPVGDAFAADLSLGLYDRLLDKGRALPEALQLALDEALAGDGPRPPLSPVTPILFGPRAAGLQLAPPSRPPDFTPPRTGLINFPPEPARFVGRVRPLLRASQALAPGSERRGVLFYGMPGAGKTACALELAYRHEQDRFQGQVWYRAPEEGQAIDQELFNLMFEIEVQLDTPDLGLTAFLDDPQRWRAFTLRRLRGLLQEKAILLVLDNVESLLTGSDNWRDPRWGDLLAALLGHDGASRVVLTSRRRPAGLASHPRLHQEAIHALSFAESVLLARELPHLRALFDDAEGRGLLRRALRLAQGHPKLLELADGLAEDRQALARQLDAAEEEAAAEAGVLEAFLAPRPEEPEREGESQQPEAAFVQTLQRWTRDVAGRLSPGARTLFTFLCRLEPADRTLAIVQANWDDFLERSGERLGQSAETSGDAPSLLEELEGASLAEVERPADADDGQTTIAVHPGVAETELAAADPDLLAAADEEMGDYWIAVYRRGRETEMEGGTRLVAESGRRAAPYLLRRERWDQAGMLLERMLQRDSSPATLAFALPQLRRIVEESGSLESAGVLAYALRNAGRAAEAEQMERDRIKQCVAQGNYRLASVAAGQLLNLLLADGRYEQALALAEEMVAYTRRAGLGPWTQLLDEGMRLQALNAMGQYEAVLAHVEELRPQLEELPLEGDAEEAANPWNVREGLLDTGREAAMRSGQWQAALALNAERVAYKEERGAGALEVARTRFNDYFPLLRLGRLDRGPRPAHRLPRRLREGAGR